MNKFLYKASEYTSYRPEYPDSLFEYLKELHGNELVLECGAGSGQSTRGLASHFKKVIATDLSLELLLEATSLQNVFYIQSAAEKLPIRSNFIDLVCIAQAMHWFSLDDFYKEVKRILKPKGFIAAWCYNQASIEPDIDQVINKIYIKIKGNQNPSRERQYLYDHYQSIPFPFERIPTPTFEIKMKWNLMQLLGYMSTWPGIIEYQKRFNIELVEEVKDEICDLWGETSDKKLIIWPIHLLVGRRN